MRGPDAATGKEGYKVARVVGADERHVDRPFRRRPRLGDRQVDHHDKDYRPQQRAEKNRRQYGAPVQRVIEYFLSADRENRRDHYDSPPTAETKISSRSLLPYRAASSDGVPLAAILPWAMITRSSASAEISCMT